jgi:hypothetical protein
VTRTTSPPVPVPDYYEDTNFAPATRRDFTGPSYQDIINTYGPTTPSVPRHNNQPRSVDIATEAREIPPLRLRESLYQKLLAAKSETDLPNPEDPEEAAQLERAWNIKQRKITRNCVADRDPEDGLTELFSLIRIPPENH